MTAAFPSPRLPIRLTDNYTLEDFAASAGHPDWNERNLADALLLKTSILQTAQDLETLTQKRGLKYVITSGHRCAGLNSLIGGSKFSQHMRGEAADGHFGEGNAARQKDEELQEDLEFIWRKSGMKWHQLLIERGCLHWGRARFFNDMMVGRYDVPTKAMIVLQPAQG